MQTTELTEIQEAQVVKSEPLKSALAPAPAARRGKKPLLIGSLAMCCCALLAIVGMHVFPSQAAMPEDPVEVVALIAAEEQPLPTPQPLTEPDPATVGEGVPDLPLDSDAQQTQPEPQPEPQSQPGPQPPAAVEPPAREDSISIASRGGEGGPAALTVNGETFNYTRQLSVESTAYTWTGNTTATGTWPDLGTVAVDPRVIPLGSKLYVEGYGFATAADTGGAIKGNIIDVYFPSRDTCVKWGRKHGVTVYILE